jgi:hypothetical protein
MSGISRHCPTYGGAMADERKEDSGSKDAEVASKAIVGEVLGPEIGQAEAAQLVQKAAQRWLLKNLDLIMDCIGKAATAGDEKSLKMLFDWAFRLPAAGSGGEIPPSFAAELWKISKELLAEAGM